jgi:hypothetical protein
VSQPARQPGATIVRVDAVGTGVFAVTAGLEAVVLTRWTEIVGIAAALGLFALGCAAFLVGYAQAIQRSRTDEINVGTLFLLIGPAVPARTKRVLLSLLAAQVVVAVATAAARPFTTLAFGVLVPVFGVGLNGLWAARHGRFPPRVVTEGPAGADARPATRPGGPATSGPPTTRPPATRPRPVVPARRGDPPTGGGMEQNADHG